MPPSSFAPPPRPSPIAWTPTPSPDDALPRRSSRAGLAVLASILVLAACAGLALVLWSRSRSRAYAPPTVARPIPWTIAPSATVVSAPQPVTPPPPTVSTSSGAATSSAAPTPGVALTAVAAPAAGAAPPPGAAATQGAAGATPSASPDTATLSASSGTLTIALAHGGHRVWVDKHIVGESPGTFPVACGWHSVQIGSQGTPQRVLVPCGGDLEMR